MITAPFNFVPLSDKVFFPDWTENVSHDVPFSDGESGVIDITITAKRPIFIRDHENPELFCQHNGEYYIPSSSVKGMIRSVLEIMSFSKMSQFDDDTYAVRDLSSAKNFYMTQMGKEVNCGWLSQTQDGYVIEDCGLPGRIRHEEIDRAFSIDFASKFKKDGFEKTSEYKYDILGSAHKSITVGELYKSSTNSKYDKRLFCKYKKGGEKGTLVVTGQPTPRKDTGKMGDGKGFEFVFFDSKKELKVEKKVIENFLFAYFDKRKTEPKESPDWKFWKDKLSQGEKIPVFFQKENARIVHFGLSYLYKLPYKHSIRDGLDSIHFDERLDLAQTIFGYVSKTEALKGRVNFSHFKAISSANELKSRTEVLGTPRASYYPIYVKQQDGKLFTTYMDNFSIAGWKRYPIHKGNSTAKTEDTGNTNIGTTFTPLKDGVTFEGKLRYHNLKKAELGAILSALTFHNTKECLHNIGMAKSLGYGKISLKINGIDDIEQHLKVFELEMNTGIDEWAKTEQLKELFSMASEQNNSGDSKLTYMSLKDFANNKSKTKSYLKNYTALQSIKSAVPASLVSQEDLAQAQTLHAEREKAQQLIQEAKKQEQKFQKKLEIILKSDNIQQIENFINNHPEYKKIDEIKTKLEKFKNSQESDRFATVDANAKAVYEVLQKKKGNLKQYTKEKDKFIKKWSAGKNNKKSSYILDLVKKLNS